VKTMMEANLTTRLIVMLKQYWTLSARAPSTAERISHAREGIHGIDVPDWMSCVARARRRDVGVTSTELWVEAVIRVHIVLTKPSEGASQDTTDELRMNHARSSQRTNRVVDVVGDCKRELRDNDGGPSAQVAARCCDERKNDYWGKSLTISRTLPKPGACDTVVPNSLQTRKTVLLDTIKLTHQDTSCPTCSQSMSGRPR
jgi:hypothetical protein